jgi:hypothetical protein
MNIDLLSDLYYYNLGIIKREDNNYSLIDLESGEWFEKMSIYYIRKLLDNWNKNTRYKDNEYVEILIQ